MGRALAEGWLAAGLKTANLAAVDPNPAAAGAARAAGIHTITGLRDLDPKFAPGWVVLAVKPQVLAEVAPPYGRFPAAFLSIVAGKTIADLAGHLGKGPEAAVVRAMPNTPATIGRGMSVACGPGIGAQVRDGCTALLAAVGDVGWIEDEALMDPVTAVSGSGPAYVFLLIEALIEAGIAQGLPADLARTLAQATVAGAGEMALRSTEDAATLRRNVTSPGGTTEAALAILMAEDGLPNLMTKAVEAATARSRELGD